MTRRLRIILLGGACVATPALVAWTTRIAPRPPRVGAAPLPAAPPGRADDPPAPARAQGEASPASAQDALLRRVDLPFAEPTTLLEVQKYLGEALGLAVVLDRAALDRLDVDPEDTVQLNIRGVRLKTGLKLLLDQLDMTYRVEPEDNLLILTDAREAGDPTVRALVEIRALHREVHDLQDAVDDLRDLVEDDLDVEPEATGNASTFVRARPDRHGHQAERPDDRRPRPRRTTSRPG